MSALDELAIILRTNRKFVAVRAQNLKLTPVCGRCGGSGNYSYNQINGTTCFGCAGNGCKPLSEKDIPAAIEGAKALVESGALDLYIGGKVAKAQTKKSYDAFFVEWKASFINKTNPNHMKRDEEVSPLELLARKLNAKIADGFREAMKLDWQGRFDAEKHIAHQAALETVREMIANLDTQLRMFANQ